MLACKLEVATSDSISKSILSESRNFHMARKFAFIQNNCHTHKTDARTLHANGICVCVCVYEINE